MKYAPHPVLIFAFFLVSCAPAIQSVSAESLPNSASPQNVQVVIHTPTSMPAATVTPLAPVLMEATPIPCDPNEVDFCITEGHFIFQNPIFLPGNTFVDVSYRYGSTQENKREPHHGVEFLNKFGTPVHAAGDGVVQFAGQDKEAVYSPWKKFYGNMVVIRHEDEMYTLYGHLSTINVQAGDEVKAGDLIGEVGHTGVATGSHLHFEVRRGGDGTDYFSTQNPELWLVRNKDKNGNPLGALSFAIKGPNGDFRFADFIVRYYLSKTGPKVKSHYIATYSKDMLRLDENAALGDIAPGYYYINFKFNGRLYERWVEVEAGKLTQVVFVVN